VHGFRQRATPVNRNRPDPRHLRRDPRLCGVAHLELIRAAATDHEAVAADSLVSLKEENAVEFLSEAGAAQRDRLNEQEADPPCLRISTRLTDRLAYDRPLQLLNAGHHGRVGKRPCREELGVEALISATRIWHDREDGVAKWRIGRTCCAEECIRIDVLHSAANSLLQLIARDKCCGETALP
jgi:hypothetical protein